MHQDSVNSSGIIQVQLAYYSQEMILREARLLLLRLLSTWNHRKRNDAAKLTRNDDCLACASSSCVKDAIRLSAFTLKLATASESSTVF